MNGINPHSRPTASALIASTAPYRRDLVVKKPAILPLKEFDTVEISNEAKVFNASKAVDAKKFNKGLFSRVSVNELKESFSGYNNRDAVAREKETIESTYIDRSKLTAENLVLGDGVPELKEWTKEDDMERRRQSLDAWMRGEKAFDPSMLGVTSSDKYVCFASQEVHDLIKEMWSFDTSGSSQYMETAKELAELTPNDFEWMDFSGLQALTKNEKQDFYKDMNKVFAEAGIEVDASLLSYDFSTDGSVISVDGTLSKETKNEIMGLYTSNDKMLSNEAQRILQRLKELGKRNSEIDMTALL